MTKTKVINLNEVKKKTGKLQRTFSKDMNGEIIGRIENNGEYQIEGEEGFFEVVSFSDLTNNAFLEMTLIKNDFDGYCYCMREILPPPFDSSKARVFNCYKKVEGDFVKMENFKKVKKK